MRSMKTVVGSIILLAGVVIALACGILLNAGASEIIHVALGFSFALYALATFDFRMPRWIGMICAVGIGVLALIFLLQAAADITRLPWLADVAYAGLGQTLERVPRLHLPRLVHRDLDPRQPWTDPDARHCSRSAHPRH